MDFFRHSLIAALATVGALAEEGPRMVWQPVLEYLVREPEKSPGPEAASGAHRINPFIAYTHLGTDFGFHGPGERSILWQDRSVCVSLENNSEWAGMWHSLAGLAADPTATLNFARCYPSLIVDSAQPKITALVVKVSGKGRLKLEIKDPQQQRLWANDIEIDEAEPRPFSLPLPVAQLGQAKYLNWTAEPGSDICLTSLQFAVELPALTFDRYVLLTSYAKMARCYSPGTGLLKDRAHVPTGAFDSVPATGLFALATAAASQPEAGLVTPEAARVVLREIEAAGAAIPKGKGLLPHFLKRQAGRSVIHPGTEFSTVDTAIFYHSLLLAAELLNDHEIKARVLSSIRQVEFENLLLPNGSVSHGLKDDGRTLIPFSWHDWGGETALVMLLQQMAVGKTTPNIMDSNGQVWKGTGFISEIQSLFFSDFDSSTPDAVSRVNWRATRSKMLEAQKTYFRNSLPDSFAAEIGLYGLSAGEGAYGTTYVVSGVDLPQQKLIHPHYILMSAALDDPKAVYALLDRMEHAGYLTAWGLVENISANGSRYLPMISALNAGFEAIGAYHLLAKSRGFEDAIYRASRECPELREAIKLFYPGPVASADHTAGP